MSINTGLGRLKQASGMTNMTNNQMESYSASLAIRKIQTTITVTDWRDGSVVSYTFMSVQRTSVELPALTV